MSTTKPPDPPAGQPLKPEAGGQGGEPHSLVTAHSSVDSEGTIRSPSLPPPLPASGGATGRPAVEAALTRTERRLGIYRLLKELGSGGMGVVYLVEDTRTGRLAALKVMNAERACIEVERNRFLREARATAALKCDHIVTVYYVDVIDGTPFMVMELLEGQSLEDWLRKGKRAPLEMILRVGIDTARGLAVAHEHSLIHRDIKPGNLWLEEPSGRVKILDFGLVCHDLGQAMKDQSLSFAGTPGYMCPEQARSDVVDARGDLFSLGCVLYRLCAGRGPFQGGSVSDLLTALATQTPTPVRELNPSIPPALAGLVERLLAKRKEDRPPSAKDVLAELEAIKEGPPPPPPTPEPVHGAWIRRLCLGAMVLATVVLLAYLLHSILPPDGATHTPISPVTPGTHSTPPPPTATTRPTQAPTTRPPTPTTRKPQGEKPRDPWDSLRPSAIKAEDVEAMTRKGKVVPELVAVLGGTRFKHGDAILGLAYSPDGKLLASAGRDGRLEVWDARDGNRVRTFSLAAPAAAVTFTPRGEHLVAKRSDGVVHVWDVKTWHSLHELPGFAHCRGMETGRGHLAFSDPKDGNLAALLDGDGMIQVFDWTQWKKKSTFPPRAAGKKGTGLWLACGPKLATCEKEGKVRLWDLKKVLDPKNLKPLALPLGVDGLAVDGLTFRGHLLAASSGEDHKAVILDVEGRDKPRTLEQERGAYSQAFSPDGDLFALGGWEEVRLWEVKGWKKRNPWPALGRAQILDMTFSPDSKFLAVGSVDPVVHRVAVETGNELPLPDGHLGTGRTVPGLCADRFLYVEDRGGVHSWQPGMDRPVRVPLNRPAPPAVRAAAADRCGRRLVLGMEKGGVEVHEVDPPSRLTVPNFPAPVLAVAMSPGGLLAAGSAWDAGEKTGEVIFWNAETGAKVGAAAKVAKKVTVLACHPDGTQVAGGGDGPLVCAWNARTGTPTLSLPQATGGDMVVGLAYSPDGKYLAATGCTKKKDEQNLLRDGSVALWDAQKGNRVAVLLEGHPRGGEDLVFSPGSDRLAWACQDGVIRIWCVPEGTLCAEVPLGPESCQTAGLAFSKDGRHLLVTYRNGTICVLRLS